TINAVPWAEVYVDGRKVGVTPLIHHRITSGRHRVRLRNPARKRQRVLRIEIPRGGEVKRNLKLCASREGRNAINFHSCVVFHRTHLFSVAPC
ncbi:MAG: PEGA domain-containing protein, partial [Deltaproteobacteria bacterium]|nr:PEGA domain-containing protein [Deltaproteobacteria bacterium]